MSTADDAVKSLRAASFAREPVSDGDTVMSILLSPISFQLLRAGYHTGLFKFLINNPGAKIKDIAEGLKITQYSAEVLLLGLTTLKLINKVEEAYYNSPAIAATINDDAKFGFVPKFADFLHQINAGGGLAMQESIMENKPVGMYNMFGKEAKNFYFELSKNEELNGSFIQCMSACTKSNTELLVAAPIFTKINHLLDVGGNVGALAMAVAQQNPHINITVYDTPHVADIANRKFKEHHLDQRLNAIGNDVANHPFPQGNFDGVLFSHFIDIFPPEVNLAFFKKAFQCLQPKGKICVFSPMVNDDETGPFLPGIFSAYFMALANGVGRHHSGIKVVDWMHEAGFINVERQPFPMAEALITAVKP